MNNYHIHSIAACLLAALALLAQELTALAGASDRAVNPRPATPEQMQWFRDARFGLFLHWGPGSLSGMELSWARRGPRPSDGTGHYEDDKTVPQAVYDHYYQQFNPTNFDARRWVRIAQDAGMKYIVFTAKHHDGFSNFHTKQSDYNIAHTPFQRDVVQELSDACHQAGMRFGIYYSPRDWYHPDYLQGDNSKYRAFYAGQLAELLGSYGKVDILWFDSTFGPRDKWDWDGVLKLIYRAQPDILINDRYGGDWSGDFYTPEQAIGAFDRARPWESCTTFVDGQWSFRPGGILSTFREALGMLLGAVGGDGNLLLNLGPMPTGEIEPRQVARLREVGAWLKENGEAVYGTRGGPYISGGWGYSTLKQDRIYLHLTGWDTAELTLPPIGRKILSRRLLSGGEVHVEQSDRAVTIRLPQQDRKEPVTVVELRVDGPAVDIPPVGVPPSGSLTRGKPVSTGSNGRQRAWWHNPCPPHQAVDDSPLTRWRAEEGATTAWIQVDLGAAVNFDRAMIDDDDTVTAFEIQVLIGQDWKTVHSGGRIGQRRSVRFPPVTGRQVRLHILAARETPSIWEFQLY
jgi:alpha-L-fucosidase